MQNDVLVGRIYRHFKGNYYYIKDIVLSSETLEKQVVYQGLYGDSKIFVRPYESFIEKIDKSREDNITNQSYRFELVDLEK